MCRNDEKDFWTTPSRLPPAEWEHFKRGAIQRAQDARAYALRDLLRGLRGLAGRAAVKTDNWRKAYALRRERRAAIRDLNALDDRMLKDIGLGRSEIESVIHDSERLLGRDLAAVRCQARGERPQVAAPPSSVMNSRRFID